MYERFEELFSRELLSTFKRLNVNMLETACLLTVFIQLFKKNSFLKSVILFYFIYPDTQRRPDSKDTGLRQAMAMYFLGIFHFGIPKKAFSGLCGIICAARHGEIFHRP